MRSCRSLFAAATLLLAGASPVVAQFNIDPKDVSTPITYVEPRAKVLVGPVIGVNRNFHTGGFRTVTGDLSCPLFEQGSGWGLLGGITAEIALGASSALIPRVTYESRPGSFHSELPDALVLMPGAEETVTQSVTASSQVDYSIFNAELLYKQELQELGTMRIGVAGGLAAAYVIAGRNRQVQDLIEPQNARFTNTKGFAEELGGRRLVFFDDEIPARQSMRLSLKAGVQAEVGLFGNSWYMTPGLYYDFGLTDVTRGENWQLNTLMVMVDFRRGM